METTEINAFELVCQNPGRAFEDGFTGNEPFFNVALMTGLAKEKLHELKSLPQFDLATEAGRKSLRAAIKPIKSAFADFEKNIKVVKKSLSEIPKKCDAVSKALRDLSEPEIAMAERPLAELKEQEATVQKWWKKEGIPHAKWELEKLLNETEDSEPSAYSTPEEAADFAKRRAEYLAAAKEALNRIILAEKTELEAKEARAPIPAPSVSAAPEALSKERKLEMRREAAEAMRRVINGVYECDRDLELAQALSRAIRDCKIPHVRYCYENSQD